jgi:site-specific DNA recombinase
MVQAKLAHNQQTARRNNSQHQYLLRGLVSCGQCRLTATARTTADGRAYYPCRGRTDKLRRAEGRSCTTRYTPAQQLDEVVWHDLCAILTEPQTIATALERAHSGQWLPQEVQARRTTVEQGLAGIERQHTRLLDAYLGEVIELTEFERKRHELERRRTDLAAQLRQLDALADQHRDLGRMARSMEEFCVHVRTGLAQATFAQKRTLVELLIDCVIVTNEEVEIRYVIPTTRAGPRQRFCHLRIDYRASLRI